MKSKVIKAFRDKLDNGKSYRAGDIYEHESADRVAFLVERGFLEERKLPPEKQEKEQQVDTSDTLEGQLKHVGGGTFELPNGEKVKGKEKALEALATLESGE